MNKKEFLEKLRENLSGLPSDDIEERLNFYSEMIDDRTEDGLTEEAAVTALGNAREIAEQIISDIPLAKLVKKKVKSKKKMKVWEIVLLAVGSPIWLSLAIAAFAVILSLYVSLWSVIISFWSVFASFAACVFGLAVGGIVLAISGNAAIGAAVIGAALVCAGLSIFSFFGCNAATKGTLILTKKIVLGIKKKIVKKEEL